MLILSLLKIRQKVEKVYPNWVLFSFFSELVFGELDFGRQVAALNRGGEYFDKELGVMVSFWPRLFSLSQRRPDQDNLLLPATTYLRAGTVFNASRAARLPLLGAKLLRKWQFNS